MTTREAPESSSFRDPAGHIFLQNGVVYRRVTALGEADYQHLMRSGLYGSLAGDGLLVAHEDLGLREPEMGAGVPERVLRPEPIPVVSYAYEWSFSQLKDAALLTLAVMERALAFGMALKDASTDNVQFVGAQPVFVDTLSFERLRPGPWVAYRQFCQQFLAPLALAAFRDARLNVLPLAFPDGVPLDLASRLLPRSTLLRPGLLVHLHLHAWAEKRLARGPAGSVGPGRTRGPHREVADERRTVSRLRALVEHLRACVEALRWQPRGRWSDYEERLSPYTADELARKEAVVRRWLEHARPRSVWDLGANVGRFSRIAAGCAPVVVAIDADPACVDTLYRALKDERSRAILPLVVDLASPSPGRGWAGRERASLEARGPADVALALALVHHLSIVNNVPLAFVAEFLSRLARTLIVEFVPPGDPGLATMAGLLERRPAIAAGYTQERFGQAFGRYFRIEAREVVTVSGRTVYLMERA